MSDQRNRPPRDLLIGLVEQILAKNAIAHPVSIDSALTEMGLSSIDMVGLMLAVEAEFDIEIPPSDISPENFRSIATIEALVAKMVPRLAS